MTAARVLLAACVAVVLLPPGTARAHAYLVTTAPAQGATLSQAPDEVVLEFNEPVEPDFNQVQVRGPGGERVDAGAPLTEGAVVRVGLEPVTAGGDYEVAYRVLSTDGHPVEGSFTFTLEAPAANGPAATDTTTPQPTATGTAAQPSEPRATATAVPTTEATPAPSPVPTAGATPLAEVPEEPGGALPWVLLAAVAALTGAGLALLRGRRTD